MTDIFSRMHSNVMGFWCLIYNRHIVDSNTYWLFKNKFKTQRFLCDCMNTSRPCICFQWFPAERICGKCLPCLWQMFALSVANVCLACGKCLPCLWQMFALPVANVCLAYGKCLPCLWQIFALSVENVCLVCGKCLPCLWQIFALSVANICLVCGKCNVCLVCGKCLPCLWQIFALSVANICLVCGKCLPCLWPPRPFQSWSLGQSCRFYIWN